MELPVFYITVIETNFFPAYPIGHYHWHNQDINNCPLTHMHEER